MPSFRILGPLSVIRSDTELELGPPKQRALLAALLCHANSVVSTTYLVDVLWPERRPESAMKNLQAYASGLRKIVRRSGVVHGAVHHEPPGYRISLARTDLDASEFAVLARRGGAALRAGETATAADLLRTALRLWRGPVFAEFSASPALRAEAEKLSARRLETYELLIDAHLAMGTAAELLGEIDDLCREYPLRERLRGLQMAALHQCGRGTDAFAVFDELRQSLARELGLAPSPALVRRYEAMLAARPTAPRARCWLPRDTDDFTGRDTERDRLLDALATPSIAVVHGPPGVGKTTLAVHVAHRLRTAYPDGRFVVRVRGRSPAQLLGELLRRLGVDRLGADPATAADVADLPAVLQARLAQLRVLLVLDDSPDVRSVRSLLPGLGDSAAVVTSRRLLAVDSARYVEVRPFPVPDAVELLGRIVGADRVADDPAAAEDVVRRARLLPAAIRAAGTGIIARDGLPGSPSTVESAVRQIIAALLADLTADERRVLTALAETPVPPDTGGLAKTLTMRREDVTDVLEELVRAHAVTEHPGLAAPRYQLAEWLRGKDFGRRERAVLMAVPYRIRTESS